MIHYNFKGKVMSIYLSEEEQLERIREWFKQYGLTLLFSIIIAIMLSVGYRYWQTRVENNLHSASNLYEQMLIQTSEGNLPQISNLAEQLISNYASTPYATLASLMLAKNDMQQNQLDKAEKHLLWAVEHSSSETYKSLAILRLARIFIAEGKANQAIDITAKVKHKAFEPLFYSVRGDAYMALKEEALAKEAYESAIKAFGHENNPFKTLIEMKLNDLP